MTLLISRKEALLFGTSTYFTGKPCKHGHISERYTLNKTCCVCANLAANVVKGKNKAKYIESNARWVRANPDKALEYQRTYNRKKPGKRNTLTANYRSAKSERMPEWLTDGHIFEIECVYTYCSALRSIGLDYHVDHIVPLRGRIVSGLHTPWNLQILTGSENMSKGNRFNA